MKIEVSKVKKKKKKKKKVKELSRLASCVAPDPLPSIAVGKGSHYT